MKILDYLLQRKSDSNIDKKDDPSLSEILAWGNDVIAQVHRTLVIGASNIQNNRTKTANAAMFAVLASRFIHFYLKIGSTYRLFYINASTSNNPKTKQAIIAIAAARAYLNRTGNCSEMASLALYFYLKKQFKHMRYDIICFQKPFDHFLLKISSRRNPKQEAVFVDPWAKLCFKESDYDINIAIIRKKLILENTLPHKLNEMNARTKIIAKTYKSFKTDAELDIFLKKFDEILDEEKKLYSHSYFDIFVHNNLSPQKQLVANTQFPNQLDIIDKDAYKKKFTENRERFLKLYVSRKRLPCLQELKNKLAFRNITSLAQIEENLQAKGFKQAS